MPELVIYTIFETPAGLEIKPNPALNEAEKRIRIFNRYIGRLVQVAASGASIGEYVTGSDDTPIDLSGTVMFPDASNGNAIVAHTKEVEYYFLDGTKRTVNIKTNEELWVEIGNYHGFTNPSPDFL